jgi:hypothetical protein
MRTVLAGLVSVLIGLPAWTAAAPLRSTIEQYGRLYRDPAASVESLYGLARAIGDSLLTGYDMDSMNTPAFDSLSARLPGMWLERDVVMRAVPDVPTFQRLARARGDSADVEYFETMFAIEDSSAWPHYVEHVTDESGCVRFGSGLVVDAYARWRKYLDRHPGRYAQWAQEEAGAIVTELAGSPCACGDRASVLRELELFLERFPKGDDSDIVRARWNELRSGGGELREHCGPG